MKEKENVQIVKKTIFIGLSFSRYVYVCVNICIYTYTHLCNCFYSYNSIEGVSGKYHFNVHNYNKNSPM